MNGLLGNLLNPNPDNGLLNLSLNLAQAGGSGQPFMSGLAGAVQQTRDQTQQMRQQAREQQKQQLLDKALAGIDPSDADLQLAAALGPEVVGQMLVARQRAQYGVGGENTPDVQQLFNASVADGSWNVETDGGLARFVDQYQNRYGAPIVMQTPTGPIVRQQGSKVGARDTSLPNLPIDSDPNVVREKNLGAGLGTGEAEKTLKAVTAKTDADKVLMILQDAEDTMTKGLLRPDGTRGDTPTASGIGAGVDWLTDLAGIDTESKSAASYLDTKGATLTGLQPRFEGPQSNYDVDLYKQMAGKVADRALSMDARLQSLRAAKEIAKWYADGNGLKSMSPTAQRLLFGGGAMGEPSAASPSSAPRAPAPAAPQVRAGQTVPGVPIGSDLGEAKKYPEGFEGMKPIGDVIVRAKVVKGRWVVTGAAPAGAQ